MVRRTPLRVWTAAPSPDARLSSGSPARRMNGTPCKRMRSAGRVDDDGTDDGRGLGGSRPWAGRTDVAAAQDRGGAAPPARRGPGDGPAGAGGHGGDVDR